MSHCFWLNSQKVSVLSKTAAQAIPKHVCTTIQVYTYRYILTIRGSTLLPLNIYFHVMSFPWKTFSRIINTLVWGFALKIFFFAFVRRSHSLSLSRSRYHISTPRPSLYLSSPQNSIICKMRNVTCERTTYAKREFPKIKYSGCVCRPFHAINYLHERTLFLLWSADWFMPKVNRIKLIDNTKRTRPN